MTLTLARPDTTRSETIGLVKFQLASALADTARDASEVQDAALGSLVLIHLRTLSASAIRV